MAQRTTDIPGTGTFPYKTHKMEVMLLADIISTNCPAPLGYRKTDIEGTFRIPGTADELGGSPHMLDRQGTAAGRTMAEIELLCSPIPDIITDYLLVSLKLIKCGMQHGPRFGDDIIAGASTLFNLLHMRFYRLGHIGFCDRVGIMLECFCHDPPYKSRAQGVSFNVFAGDQFCDYFVPGAFCT